MGSWVTKAYTFVESGNGYDVVTTNLTGKFLTAKLTKNLGDTAKFNFSLPYADGKDLFPLKTYIDVVYQNDDGVYPETEGMIKGAITKRSYSAVDGIFTFESCGVLGMYQFIPPYRNYGVVSIQEYIDTEQKRFRGIASAPYACDNPHTELLDDSGLFGIYGYINVGDYSSVLAQYKPAFNLAIQKTAKNSYEFLKQVTKQGNYVFPPAYQTFLPPLYREYYDYIRWFPVAGVNGQTVRYDKNLLSCSIDDIPYKTEISASANGVSYSEKSSEYPNPFYYSDESLKDKTDKTPYTQNDISNYVKTALNDEKVVVDAIGFDYHFVDNTVPLLDIYQFVDLTYWDGTAEQTVRAQITQITYDLLNPANDRVKMGKVQEPITSQVSGNTTEVIDETVKEYLPLSGGTMTGDLKFKDSSSVVSDSNHTIRDRIFGSCNLLDSALIEQGGMNGSTGAHVPTNQKAICCTQYIKVSPNTTYTCSWSGALQPAPFFYNSSKGFISYQATSGDVTSLTFTTPNNCYFVRMSWDKVGTPDITPSVISNVQLEKGSQPSSYVPYTMDGVEVAERLNYKKIYFTPTNCNSESSYDGCYYFKANGIVHVHIGASAPSSMGSVINIGTLPSGYRPKGVVRASGESGNNHNVQGYAYFRVMNDGTIDAQIQYNYFGVDFCFLAEN